MAMSVQRAGRVGSIALSGRDNSTLSLDDLRRLALAIEETDRDPETSVLVLSGPAGTFCAGGDLADFLACHDLDELDSVVRRFFRALLSSQKPLVAAVDGAAIGLGMTMLLHFDAVFATPDSTFVAPFADLGLVPEAGATILAPARFGYLRAFELLCIGRKISAVEACAIGLVSEVTEPHAAELRAAEVAHRLAKKPDVALQATRRLLRGERADVEQRIDLEIAHFRAQLEDAATARRLARITSYAARRAA